MARREVVDGISKLKGDQHVKFESQITENACRLNVPKERMTPLSREKLMLEHSDVCGLMEREPSVSKIAQYNRYRLVLVGHGCDLRMKKNDFLRRARL